MCITYLAVFVFIAKFARPYPTFVPAGTEKRWLGIGGHALLSGCLEHSIIQP